MANIHFLPGVKARQGYTVLHIKPLIEQLATCGFITGSVQRGLMSKTLPLNINTGLCYRIVYNFTFHFSKCLELFQVDCPFSCCFSAWKQVKGQ